MPRSCHIKYIMLASFPSLFSVFLSILHAATVNHLTSSHSPGHTLAPDA